MTNLWILNICLTKSSWTSKLHHRDHFNYSALCQWVQLNFLLACLYCSWQQLRQTQLAQLRIPTPAVQLLKLILSANTTESETIGAKKQAQAKLHRGQISPCVLQKHEDMGWRRMQIVAVIQISYLYGKLELSWLFSLLQLKEDSLQLFQCSPSPCGGTGMKMTRQALGFQNYFY